VVQDVEIRQNVVLQHSSQTRNEIMMNAWHAVVIIIIIITMVDLAVHVDMEEIGGIKTDNIDLEST
jgi:hypothetical protein